MGFATIADKHAIEAEARWEERDLPRSIWQMLEGAVKQHAQRPAVSYQLLSDPKAPVATLTWAELRNKTGQTANAFARLGITHRDTVAFILPNCLEAMYALLGGAVAGRVNPINPLLNPAQMASILRKSGAKVVVTLKAFPKTDVAAKVAEAVQNAPDVKHVLEVDLNTYLTPPKSWLVPLLRPKHEVGHNARIHSFNALIAAERTELNNADLIDDRIIALFHTGGTTGMPKLAQHSFGGAIYNGWLGHHLLYSAEDVALIPLPLFHVFAVYPALMGIILSGAHIVLPTPQGYRGDGVFDNFWKLIERHKATVLFTVPTAAAALMQRPVNADVSSLRLAFSGSAPFPMELFRRFTEATDVKIIEGYGLTEATCLVACNPVDAPPRIGSVGMPLPYTDVRICKPSANGGLEGCATDEIGEICVSNPGVLPGGTYSEPEKNADLYLDDTFLRTGDLGRLDEDGFLWITGRVKDLIIRGGHNIDPSLIEEALLSHEAVGFAGAIGQPDAYSGELPCVYVELVQGASVTEQELMEHATQHIGERAAIPKHLEILDELPKTAVGKVFKPDLRKRATQRVFDSTLKEAGMAARVTHVVDDPKRGLTAQISPNGSDAAELETVLAGFARPWEIANNMET